MPNEILLRNIEKSKEALKDLYELRSMLGTIEAVKLISKAVAMLEHITGTKKS